MNERICVLKCFVGLLNQNAERKRRHFRFLQSVKTVATLMEVIELIGRSSRRNITYRGKNAFNSYYEVV